MRRRFTIAAAFVLATVVSATASDPAAAPQTQVAPPAGVPAVGAPPVVRLISTGAEPRQLLRYRVPDGFKGRMQMTMGQSMQMDIGGAVVLPETAAPKIIQEFDLAVTAISSAGDLSVRADSASFKIDTTGVEPRVARAAEALDPSGMVLSMTAVMNARGVARDVVVDTSKIANPAVRALIPPSSSTFAGLSLQLPEEPVGVGAQWEVRMPLATKGLNTVQIATVELMGIEGTKVRLRTSLSGWAPPEAGALAGLPAGASAQLRDFTLTGGGTTVFDLTSLLMEQDQIVNLSVTFDLTAEGSTQPMRMKMTMQTKTVPVK
jgi:hypothetical protein